MIQLHISSAKVDWHANRKVGQRSAWFLAFIGIILLTGCTSSRGGSISYENANFGAPDPLSQTALSTDYRIAPLDKLAIQVFQVADLSATYEVDLTGRITMPLIGSLRVVDMTADDLTAELERRYGEDYLRNPQIAVGIAESRGSVITLEGSVTQPGMYPVQGRTTLLQAIAMARGLHELANPRRVAIFRQIDGQRMAAAFDLTTIRAGEGDDPEVYRGDIIVVDGNSGRQTWLDVLRSLPVLSIFSPIY